jgi:thiol-disulfide isomerase/thioredoxin
MKKTIQLIVLAMLCLNFSSKVTAQTPQNKAIDVTTKGIQIGQKVPDVTISNLHNYKDAKGQPATTAKLSDFKGKLLILDFWATWCSPCLAMIPKMDSLQQQFGDKIQFLSVTYQTEKEVMPFLNKLQKGKPSNLPQITGDKQLHHLFPHSALPHYVWINKDGILKALTSFKEVTSLNIMKVVSGDLSTIKQRKVQLEKYDATKPLFVNGNGGDGTGVLYRSVLTGFNQALPARFEVFKPDSLGNIRLVVLNVPLKLLFLMAYGEGLSKQMGLNRVQMNVKDTTRLNSALIGDAYDDWLRQGNGYCYELIVSKSMSKNMWVFMQQDLARFFDHYKARIIKKKVKCLALVRTSNLDKLKSKGGPSGNRFEVFGCTIRNKPISVLYSRLNAYYLQKLPMPLVDLTNYAGPVDLDIRANLSKVTELNTALATYDLALKETVSETNFLEITDTLNP